MSENNGIAAVLVAYWKKHSCAYSKQYQRRTFNKVTAKLKYYATPCMSFSSTCWKKVDMESKTELWYSWMPATVASIHFPTSHSHSLPHRTLRSLLSPPPTLCFTPCDMQQVTNPICSFTFRDGLQPHTDWEIVGFITLSAMQHKRHFSLREETIKGEKRSVWWICSLCCTWTAWQNVKSSQEPKVSKDTK